MFQKNFFFLFFFMGAFYGQAQKTISGTITDSGTGQPIEGVAIYFDKTSIWTLTDREGDFELKIPRQISSPLIINFLGYKQIVIENPFTKEDWGIRMIKQPNELNPVYIARQKRVKKHKTTDPAPFSEQEQREYKSLFVYYFIGKGNASNKTEILNEEVLQVNSRKTGNDSIIINISALEPLKIKNDYLKYDITYTLDTAQILMKRNPEFDMWIPHTFQSAGTYFFKDLLDSEKRNRRFHKRRKNAYEGSVLHFMRALSRETLKEEGFFVYKEDKKGQKNNPPQKKEKISGMVNFKLVPHENFTEVLPPASFVVIYKETKRTNVAAKQNFGIGKYGNYFPWYALNFTGHMGLIGVSSAVPLDYFPEDD